MASADFDGDGKADYLLFNASTRQTAIWYMNDTQLVVGHYGPTLPPGWTIAGVGDFNGDGQADYLLYSASLRQTAIWYLNGFRFADGKYAPALPAGWTVAAVADFNATGNLTCCSSMRARWKARSGR